MHHKNTNIIHAWVVALFTVLGVGVGAISTDNSCTFKTDGKLFTFALLNQITSGDFYKYKIDDNNTVVFNFCDPFIPKECGEVQSQAYSFVVTNNNGEVQCTPFSSNSKLTHFTPQYLSQKGEIKINLSMTTYESVNPTMRTTDFLLDCEQEKEEEGKWLKNIRGEINGSRLVIYGMSPYACPVFQLSSIWKALTENQLIFGVLLVIIGFVMLFFGILMTHLMIFITAYILSFAALAAIFSAFLRPDSNTLEIYFALLFILFVSTLIAYSMTKLVKVSIFFIGAFFGFLLAAILNSIFAKIFDIYSIWSLIVFEVLLTIPFGLLTFKHSDEVIVMSSSLGGSYMIVRPLSWLLGGFPNQFTLYALIEKGEIVTLPWTIFLYLLLIVLIGVVGAMYQLLKIKRRKANHQIDNNFITENVEVHIDRIKLAVENIINKYAPQTTKDDRYQQFQEMEEYNNHPKQTIGIESPKKTQERKSREQNF